MDEQPAGQGPPELGSGKGAPPEDGGSGGGAGKGGDGGKAGAPAAVVFPKPPRLLRRIALLCLQPESWAQAARYRTGVTVLTLLTTIVLMAAAVGMSAGVGAVRSLREFGQVYDQIYPRLEISSAGVLSAPGGVKEPLRMGIGPYRILVDLRGGDVPESVLDESPIVLTDHQVIESLPVGVRLQEELKNSPPYAWLVPKQGVTVLDGASIQGFVERDGMMVGMVVGLLMFVGRLVADVLWAALMVLAVYPLPILAAGMGGGEAFVIPRRAGVRMALAVLAPLVVVGGVLEAMGRPVSDVMGAQVVFFWMAAAAVLAFWSGRMARRLYGPKPRAREAE